jgi:hypothetical protein
MEDLEPLPPLTTRPAGDPSAIAESSKDAEARAAQRSRSSGDADEERWIENVRVAGEVLNADEATTFRKMSKALETAEEKRKRNGRKWREELASRGDAEWRKAGDGFAASGKRSVNGSGRNAVVNAGSGNGTSMRRASTGELTQRRPTRKELREAFSMLGGKDI